MAAAAAIWGVSFVIVKDAYTDISPVLLLTLRFGAAALLMPLLAWKRILRTPPTRLTLRGGLLTGAFLGIGMIFQMVGLQYTSAANSGFLTALYIVLVPFVTFFVYRSGLEWREIWAILLATLGIGLLSLAPGVFTLNRGDLLTIASALTFAFQVVLVQRYSSAGQDAWVAWLQVVATALICGAAVLLGVDGQPFARWTPRLLWALAFTTFGATVLAFFLQAWGQKQTTAARAALLFSTEPVFAGLASTLFLGESWSLRRLSGAALILLAVLVAEFRSSDLKPQAQSEHINR